jgi:hypothetical protein
MQGSRRQGREPRGASSRNHPNGICPRLQPPAHLARCHVWRHHDDCVQPAPCAPRQAQLAQPPRPDLLQAVQEAVVWEGLGPHAAARGGATGQQAAAGHRPLQRVGGAWGQAQHLAGGGARG